jgi:hypothetical protein
MLAAMSGERDEPITFGPMPQGPITFGPMPDEPITFGPMPDEPITFGPMPDLADIHAAIGRMALEAAGLEWWIASCRVVIGDFEDAETASLDSVSRNIKKLRKWLARDDRLSETDKAWMKRWLTDSERASHRRNRIVHSVVVLDQDGAALYHPRSQKIHRPTVEEVDAIAAELERCAGVGLAKCDMLARAVGYTPTG